MSMPGKGKHHHLPHHHQQQHHPQQIHHQQQQLHQAQHIVNVNVNQPGVAHSPQAYNTVVAANQQRFVAHGGGNMFTHAPPDREWGREPTRTRGHQDRPFKKQHKNRSDFHVPPQNYAAQQGGQVGGGGGNVGVPGGRGPPPLGGIQSIGQSTTGIPPGGPAAGPQAPSQAPAPGVQPQQPQGPTPTTTPPVHNPSPQEMGKPGHLQTIYVQNQQRQSSPNYYPPGPRPQQPRGMNHRGGQGGAGAQVALAQMARVPDAGVQQIQYQHHNMYVQSQVPGIQHQPPVNYPIQLQYAPRPPQHNQAQFPQVYQLMHHPGANIPGYYQYQPTQQQLYAMNPAYLRSAANVNTNAQHMQGQLANAQGTSVVPQGSLQQPAQQPQAMTTMMPVTQTEVYSGHNGGSSSASSSVTSKKSRRANALEIVDPMTGKDITDELYDTDPQKGDAANREAAPEQNCDMTVRADFAAMVARVATEPSSDSPVATSAPESPTSQNPSQSLSNLKVQTNSNTDTNSQPNTGPPSPMQTKPGDFTPTSQTLDAPSNTAQVESCPVKVESKPLQPCIAEFQPRRAAEVKTTVVTEDVQSQKSSMDAVVIKNDKIPTQALATNVPAPEVEVKSASLPQVTSQTPHVPSSTPSSNIPDVPVPSATALGPISPLPTKEPFPNLAKKNKSSSPPRRKSQNPPSNAITVPEMPPPFKESKDQKERKANEKNASSRGTTPTPAHNQPEHIHQKTNGETAGDKTETESLPKNEAQKTADGKSAMQKQKNKSKQKGRDLNRRGAEKEGTDMDAFVNAIPPKTIESAQTEIKETTPQRDSNKEPVKEITKDIKEKDNHESKKEKQASTQSQEKHASPEVTKESTPIIEKPPAPFNHKDSQPTIEDSSKSPVVSNMAPVPTDDVDHSISFMSGLDLKSIVAQKNEENAKVSALRASNEETSPVIAKQDENAAPNQLDSASKGPQGLKYSYQVDQWSPINQEGKKVYGREFLMKLQEDPNSKIKPMNLPDLDVVLKDSTRIRQYPSRNRSPEMRQFRDQSMGGRHDMLFPGFAKNSSLSSKMGGMLPPNKKSNPGRPRGPPEKPGMRNISLGQDVKLRETENAWKPTRFKSGDVDEELAKTEALAKRVRSVLNKLTPQKFETLVSQVRKLEIDTKERMQEVIKLVFEKAIDEPSFSVAYALMCKELATMQVTGGDPGESTNSNFRKLIITRCQTEFEKESANEKLRETKAKEIEACTDPEKKKELQMLYEEEERRIRMKSVGNIRFIGELFKQGMLTKKIMHFCINHLLQRRDEENLECLCKLLTTIGKSLENNDDLKEYINKMQSIANDKGPGKISSRVRFMLKDVIDLRSNKWVPRRDDSNPKTMDQIQREQETERLVDAHLNNAPMNTPRRDDRGGDRRRNRGGPSSSDDGGWSQPVASRASRTTYSVETAKLKHKPVSMDDFQLGSSKNYMWNKGAAPPAPKTVTPNKFAALENITSFDQEKRIPMQLPGSSRSTGPREYGSRSSDYKSSYEGRSSRNGSHQLSSGSSSREPSVLDSARSQSISLPPPSKPAPQTTSNSNKPEKSESELMNVVTSLVEEYVSVGNDEDVVIEIRENFSNSQLPMLVREMINAVIEKSSKARESISKLLSFLLTKKVITLSQLRQGLGEVLEFIDDLIIDIPTIWSYLADILLHLVINGTHPIAELKTTLATLRSKGQTGKLVGELFSKMSAVSGPKLVSEMWSQSGLQLSDIINEALENIDEIVSKYKLQFLSGDSKDIESCTAPLSLEQIHDHLKKLMERNSSFDVISNWITLNVGDRAKDPQFIRTLMTAILEISTVFSNNRYDFKTEIFQGLQLLIQRFVDANENLELQCLFAAQAFANKLEFPSGLLLNIFDKLCDDNIISFESFIQWETNDDATEREGKAVALKALTSFFTSLKEAEEVSEEESVTSSQCVKPDSA